MKNELSFHYKVGNRDLKYISTNINKFISTTFREGNSKLSLTPHTVIDKIIISGIQVNELKQITTVEELQNKLKQIEIEHISQNPYVRKSTHSIDEIKELTSQVLFYKDKRQAKVELDGDLIKGNSQRYQVFFTKGITCSCCGIKGKYFAKEKFSNQKSYHLNLYAIDKNGNEVMMTKDHIIPKSKGGKDELDNYQPMCFICNKAKGNKL